MSKPTSITARVRRRSSAARALARWVGPSAIVLGALLVPVPAMAASYTVDVCRIGAASGAAEWQPKALGDSQPGPVSCHDGGYAFTQLGPDQRSTTAMTGFGLRAPDGLTFNGVKLNRWVRLRAHHSTYAEPRYDMVSGSDWTFDAPDVRETCVSSLSCAVRGWDGAPGGDLEVKFAAATRFFGFALRCYGDPAGACLQPPSGDAYLRVNSAAVTVDDDAAPQFSTPGGTLVQPGPRAGVESLTFSATDRGSGVQDVTISADGAVVQRTTVDPSPGCRDLGPVPGVSREYDRLQPCAGSSAVRLAVDTATIADGERRIDVTVRDAAGNASPVFSQVVTIDNVPLPSVVIRPTVTGEALATGLRPGDTVLALDGTWSGGPDRFTRRWQRLTPAGAWVDIPFATGARYVVGTDDVDHQLRVVVTATSGEGSVESASEATGTVKSGKTVQVQSVKAGAVNGGGGNPATAQMVVDREQRTVDVAYAAKIVVTGRLVDGDGNPIAGASVDVFEQVAVTAAPWTKIDTVKTDSQGGYVFRPKTTASRRLRFAYADRREGSDYRATRDVLVSVTAGMAIHAAHRLVPRRGLIKLRGQVFLENLPAGGSWVEVQVLDAKIWRTVATRRVGSDGRWAFKHRLRDAFATRFAFRARLRAAGDLPSVEAKSAPLKVRVR